jgi:hypothetical protein
MATTINLMVLKNPGGRCRIRLAPAQTRAESQSIVAASGKRATFLDFFVLRINDEESDEAAVEWLLTIVYERGRCQSVSDEKQP